MIDTLVFLILFLSTVLAFFRGFIQEILSLATWIVASVASIMLFPSVAPLVEPHVKHPLLAKGIAGASIFIVVFILMMMLNIVLSTILKGGKDTSLLDRTLGLGFGFLRGAFIVSLSYLLVTFVLREEDYPNALKEAQSLPALKVGAEMVASLFPDMTKSLSDTATKTQETIKESQQNIQTLQELQKMQGQLPAANPANQGSGGGAPTGYTPQQQQEMQRILNSLPNNGQ
jgi:membrane protein required for colicin V production